MGVRQQTSPPRSTGAPCATLDHTTVIGAHSRFGAPNTLAWGPFHAAAAEHVNVEVAHALLRVRPGINHDAVTPLRQSFRFGDACRNLEEPSQNCGIDSSCGVKTRHVLPRYDQDMNRRLRLYVSKGDGLIVLGNDVRGQFATPNSAKETVGHISVYGPVSSE